jgi:DNA-binding CsgD family transcriptional regulator
MLMPHIQTALRLRTKVLACNASSVFSETALEAMSIAAFLVNGKGRVRHMNQGAAAYLQKRSGLCLLHGKLTAMDSAVSTQLELLIAGAASAGRSGSKSLPGGAIRLSRPGTASPLQVAVIPAPKDNQIAGSDTFVLVFVSDPSSPLRPRTTLMQQLYGLTPTESRLAALLLQGFEVREAADRLRNTLETTRFHLKRVLAKTRTGRQSELMRLMLSLPGE